jgi:hypothetical protein
MVGRTAFEFWAFPLEELLIKTLYTNKRDASQKQKASRSIFLE